MLTEHIALKVTKKYINGWKNNDLNEIVSTLEPEIIIIESHGPTYKGIDSVKKWLGFWLEAESRITCWDITSFYFNDKDKQVFCEWEFKCISLGKTYILHGLSIIKFSLDSKILFMHEYRMTHAPYAWNEKSLQSE